MAKFTNEEIIASLKEMTMLELSSLVKAIEEEFGVTAAAPVAVAAVAAVEEGPSEVTVTLTDAGSSKVGVIKIVREITGLGLIDAKKLVDALPAEIKAGIAVEEAEGIKAKLVEAGATVEVK